MAKRSAKPRDLNAAAAAIVGEATAELTTEWVRIDPLRQAYTLAPKVQSDPVKWEPAPIPAAAD